MARGKISKVTRDNVAVNSARRCALCFGLEMDATPTRDGQLAHIDRNPENSNINNLVYLCLKHHNEYDSMPSQSMRITPGELKGYRTDLYRHVAVLRRRMLPTIDTDEAKDVDSLTDFPTKYDLFRLINPESVSGYEVLAADKKRDFCFAFSSDHVSLEKTSVETKGWLNADYVNSGRTVIFDMNKLVQLVHVTHRESDFSLLYHRSVDSPQSMVLVFGHGVTSYREVDYVFEQRNVMKGVVKSKLPDSEEKQNILRIRRLLDKMYGPVETAMREWGSIT